MSCSTGDVLRIATRGVTHPITRLLAVHDAGGGGKWWLLRSNFGRLSHTSQVRVKLYVLLFFVFSSLSGCLTQLLDCNLHPNLGPGGYTDGPILWVAQRTNVWFQDQLCRMSRHGLCPQATRSHSLVDGVPVEKTFPSLSDFGVYDNAIFFLIVCLSYICVFKKGTRQLGSPLKGKDQRRCSGNLFFLES